MVVNSISFLLFFVVVFFVYYLPGISQRKNLQNWWLLLTSYYFYSYVDWKMLPLLLGITVVYYYLGIYIKKSIDDGNSKLSSILTTIGVVIGVGVLLYFKYLNFFAESLASLLTALGLHVSWTTLNIILPVGVSFFTFKLIGYVIEVHREKIQPATNFIEFSTFIAFFPTILSGPIDRAEKFLPQLRNSRVFNYDNVTEGIRLIVWGLFIKMCLADILSAYSDAVFDNYTKHSSLTIILASCLYAIQVYADFSSYSNMAIGVGLMLGITVAPNFNRPFFGQNVSELWRRWHISLTTWITDYVFMPLNVKWRDLGKLGLYLATLVNFMIIGLWHGANWTYIVFGIYQTIIIIVTLELESPRKAFEKKHSLKKNELYKWARRGLTFVLWVIGDIMFRAPSVSDIWAIFGQIAEGSTGLFVSPLTFALAPLSFILLFYKEFNDEYKRNIHFLHSSKMIIRLLSIIILLSITFLCGNMDGGQFIYFQF